MIHETPVRSGAVAFAVGFCHHCSVPVMEDRYVSIMLDDELMLFCSERCAERFERVAFNAHGPHW